MAHGGVLLAVHSSVPAQPLQLLTPLQAVAARVYCNHRPITLCSLYLPPGERFPRLEFIQLLSELPEPLLVLGDFNSHHTLWGCDDVDARGRVLERILYEEHLGFLNNGLRTHFTLPSGHTSALDLSLASPQLMTAFAWRVADDPLGSDHFPVWLDLLGSTDVGMRPERWNTVKAVWGNFTTHLENTLSGSEESELSVEQFTEMILDAATRHIPRTSGTPRRAPVPWWTDECRAALRARRRASDDLTEMQLRKT